MGGIIVKDEGTTSFCGDHSSPTFVEDKKAEDEHRKGENDDSSSSSMNLIDREINKIIEIRKEIGFSMDGSRRIPEAINGGEGTEKRS
ncbi:hypothetical protein L1887_21892 [Cichorium endivia]|nr:hypothetical protein L1887_21892 [Cichorium endivia]